MIVGFPVRKQVGENLGLAKLVSEQYYGPASRVRIGYDFIDLFYCFLYFWKYVFRHAKGAFGNQGPALWNLGSFHECAFPYAYVSGIENSIPKQEPFCSQNVSSINKAEILVFLAVVFE